MNATFIQVDAGELEHLIRNPSVIEGLFQAEGGNPQAFINLSKTVAERVRSADPALLAASLERLDPILRERLAHRLGKIPDELATSLQDDGLLKLIAERQANVAAGGAGARDARPTLSLDKEWHGVHYLLCGETDPGTALVSQAVLGGTDIGDDEEGFSGYGPARYFSTSQVAELATALGDPKLEAQAAARFDAKRMNELQIYPGWQLSDADAVLDAMRRLRDFYSKAAADGAAIITSLI